MLQTLSANVGSEISNIDPGTLERSRKIDETDKPNHIHNKRKQHTQSSQPPQHEQHEHPQLHQLPTQNTQQKQILPSIQNNTVKRLCLINYI